MGREFPLEEEYKKKTGITPQDIAKIRAWMETQPHLPAADITDLDLILTFHCCQRSAEVSKQLVDLHFTLRTHFHNFFKNRIVDDKFLTTLGIFLYLPLEMSTDDGSKIIYLRFLDYEPKHFVYSEVIRAFLMIVDLWQYIEGTWPGLVIVVDLEKVTMGHITRVDVQSVQQFLYYLQEGMLVNLKGLHYINAPSFMDTIMAIVRPFTKKDLMKILHIHQVGARTLEKYIPMDALPLEAGGQYMCYESAKALMLAKARAGAEYFLSENKKRVIEAARPGKPKTISDIFGSVEGSFKKLDID